MYASNSLTEVQKVFLDVLQANRGWMTRSEIAAASGMTTKPFGKFYVALLDDLVDKGLVEVKTEKRGIVMQTFLYRAV